MASASDPKTFCVKCEKAGGIAICSGCDEHFCVKHFLEHRQELSRQMDEIGQQYDCLRRDFLKETCEHPFLDRIQTWEQESITKIQVAAEVARADLQQIVDRRRQELKQTIDKLTTEYQISHETENYTELDLDRWKEKIDELQQLFTANDQVELLQPSISLIKIIDRSIREMCSSIEKFDKSYGPAMITDEGLLATNENDDYSRICGFHQYSTGLHRIRFRIEQRTHSCPFIGIVSSLEAFNLRKKTLTSANGWSDFDYSIVNGHHQGRSLANRLIQTDDHVTLIIDCDHREIRLKHDRTNEIIEQQIDLHFCPFPWKFFIALRSRNESIRIVQ